MSTQDVIETEGAPNTDNPYSQAVKAGAFLFVSGFGPVDPDTLEEVSGTIEEETDQVMANLAAVVEEAGGSLDDLVKVSVYLDDMGTYDRVNVAYAEHFEDDPPARVCVEPARLPGDVRVEIDAVAYLP